MKPHGVAAACLVLIASSAQAASVAMPAWTAAEREAILSHGPWPPKLVRDPSNRVSGNARAIEFGAALFFDARLSVDASVACSTCHEPQRGWSDGRSRAIGREATPRNTKSVLDARFNRWFGWSGASDSLWAASLRPLLDPREMGSAERHVAALVRSQTDLACRYRQAFDRQPPGDDEALFVDVGKALAAYQETLVSGRTAFDEFRDALARGDRIAASRYPAAAGRGLRLFIGEAGCTLCHVGPAFTNREFDKVGIPVRGDDGRYDWGRFDGIKALQSSRFSLLGRHNDDRSGANATSTRHVALTVEAYGSFAVPTLRNVAATVPYMHNGSLPSLRDVVRHYSGLDEVKLHIAAAHPHAEPGETLPPRPTQSPLRTLNLNAGQIDDLVAFLESLTPLRAPGAPLAGRAGVCDDPARTGSAGGAKPRASGTRLPVR